MSVITLAIRGHSNGVSSAPTPPSARRPRLTRLLGRWSKAVPCPWLRPPPFGPAPPEQGSLLDADSASSSSAVLLLLAGNRFPEFQRRGPRISGSSDRGSCTTHSVPVLHLGLLVSDKSADACPLLLGLCQRGAILFGFGFALSAAGSAGAVPCWTKCFKVVRGMVRSAAFLFSGFLDTPTPHDRHRKRPRQPWSRSFSSQCSHLQSSPPEWYRALEDPNSRVGPRATSPHPRSPSHRRLGSGSNQEPELDTWDEPPAC